MKKYFFNHLTSQLEQLKFDGLYKYEREILSAQDTHVKVNTDQIVINLCANNYLGLANHPELIDVAQEALQTYGLGMASVRFICGTQSLHLQLERTISHFLGTQDTILYSSCFDANTGLFETLLSAEDAIISDSLNHASIIDGIRLCKAKRFRYANNDLNDLELKLKEADAAGARYKMIATDGVFSMDGIIANLQGICSLADKYDALVMLDDSHAVGVLGERGRGTHEYCQVMDKIDIITGTLGKALGGASGGYTSSKHPEIIEWLRNRSRPYLFSNTLTPSIAATSIKAFELLQLNPNYLVKLKENSQYFRQQMTQLGFTLSGKDHAIIPVMLGEASLAAHFSKLMLEEGVYVIGFSFPVVPEGAARIRTQISASHTKEQLDTAIKAFAKVGKKLKVIA